MDAIKLSSLTKTYRVGVGRARVREMLPPPIDRVVRSAFPRWWGRDTFNALDDVSLSVPPGSSVGIVGHNGAGKTTMLKVIAGVTAATSGRVNVEGRVAALIDVVVGLHPDLTGRENVYLLGAMHGFGRRAMRSRIDRVVEFAEIADLMDTPLKRCSAGMITRIGFGAITSLDADVLLIDEVLSVGDAQFQRKCATWLEEYRATGRTLLFVSHNLGLVRSMTDRAIWLDHGKIVSDGDTSSILLEYGRAMERREAPEETHAKGQVRKLMRQRGMNRWGMGGARVEEVHVGEVTGGGDLEVRIAFEVSELERAVFCVGFIDENGREVGAAASPALAVDPAGGEITCSIRPLPLRSGIYFPVVAILSEDGVVRDRWQLDRSLVIDRNGDGTLPEGFGAVDLAADWTPQGAGAREHG
jgi:ABC-2 type transport system ATP-binding protein/lipopolysaccharide transport system ATP-binding protein